MTPEAKLIAYLYAKGEPVEKKNLSQFLNIASSSTDDVLRKAQGLLEGTGLTLVDDGKEVDLRTESAAAPLIEQIRKDEFSREIGRAGLETLAVLLYKGPSSRSEIDYVRGVNSTYTLRSLAMRGLARRIPNPKDERSYVYEPTIELLAHLGVSSIEALPDYKETRERIAALESKTNETSSENLIEEDSDSLT